MVKENTENKGEWIIEEGFDEAAEEEERGPSAAETA